jgi:hypothetical protein
MPAVPRHAKHKAPPTARTPGAKRGAVVLVAVMLAGAAAVFVSLQGGSAAHKSTRDAIPTLSAESVVSDQMATAVHSTTAARENRLVVQRARRVARRRQLAAAAAAKAARERAAQEKRDRAAAQSSPTPTPTPTPSPSSTPPSSSGGGDAAHSALGNCIRNAEEGGSYAWGPGNGGGAYQFAIGTWENYGGAAGEFGVAGASYQDQIFDNAIAAGGASNWTNYDGC